MPTPTDLEDMLALRRRMLRATLAEIENRIETRYDKRGLTWGHAGDLASALETARDLLARLGG